MCQAGDVSFRLALTPRAGIATILDLLGSGLRANPDLLVSLARDLEEVEGLRTAGACFNSAASNPNAGQCISQALLATASSSEQLRQIVGIAARYGISVGVGEVASALSGLPLRAFQLAGSLSAYGAFLASAPDPTSLVITVRAR